MEEKTTSFTKSLKYEVKYTHIGNLQQPLQTISRFKEYSEGTELFKKKVIDSADFLQLITGTINIILYRVVYVNDIAVNSELLRSITLTSTII